jgi:hypothetical protein
MYKVSINPIIQSKTRHMLVSHTRTLNRDNMFRIALTLIMLSDWGCHAGNYEESDILVCNGVQFGEIPRFRRNISPPSSGSKCNPSKKPEQGDTFAYGHLLLVFAFLTLRHFPHYLIDYIYLNYKNELLFNFLAEYGSGRTLLQSFSQYLERKFVFRLSHYVFVIPKIFQTKCFLMTFLFLYNNMLCRKSFRKAR